MAADQKTLVRKQIPLQDLHRAIVGQVVLQRGNRYIILVEKFQIGQAAVAIFMRFAMQPEILAAHRVQAANIGIAIQPLAKLGYPIAFDFLRLAGGDVDIDYGMGLVVVFHIAAA